MNHIIISSYLNHCNFVRTGNTNNDKLDWTYIDDHGITKESDYRQIAHQISDMLLNCSWRGSPCGVDNFTQVITDLGVCYTFNANITDPLRVSQAGSKNGLSLSLNIEQDEYVIGEDAAAGIKVMCIVTEFPSWERLNMIM